MVPHWHCYSIIFYYQHIIFFPSPSKYLRINKTGRVCISYFLGERTFTGSTPGIANASLGGILVLRPYATFSHPNVLAGYLLVAMVMVWSFVLTNKKKWIQIIGMASLLTSSVALLLTFSRVAILLWGVFLLGVLVKVLFYKTKSLKAKVTIVAIIVVGLVMISFLPMVHDIVLRFSQTSLSDESVTERAELLATASVMIHQHPLFGI